jgi:hypothetical protein
MTDLSRNLLAAARDGLDPDPAVAARVRARVAAAVGAPVTVAAAATPAKAASFGLAIKLAILAGVAALGVAGIAGIAGSSREDVAAPHITLPAAEPPAVAPVALAHREASAPLAEPPPVPAAWSPPSLARETELVDAAMRALHARDFTAAIDATDTYERETRGRGQLAEDASALAIEARCGLELDVAARLSRFDSAWPSSAERRHITAVCAK